MAKQNAPRVQRGHHCAQVMIWWNVSWHGVTQIYFCEKRVKTGDRIYQTCFLESLVKFHNFTLFEGID